MPSLQHTLTHILKCCQVPLVMVWVVLCSECVYNTCSYLKSYWPCYKRPQLSVRNYLLLPRAAVPGPDLRDWSDLIWQNVHDTAQRRSSSRQSSWERFRSASPGQEGGGGRGTWTGATEGVNKAALSTEIGMLVWAVLSKILKIACQYIFVDKCSNRWRDFV